MKINGTNIADEIKDSLNKRIGNLIARGVTPKIAIITLGDESSWESYVSQKLKVADLLGIKAVLINLADSDEKTLLKTIHEIDVDPLYHGIIVQRPMPTNISREKVIEAISASKDIDGFRPDSPFEVPVWLAVRRLLEQSLAQSSKLLPRGKAGKAQSLGELKFAVLGKGETAGGPIARGLKRMGIEPKIIDSKTENPKSILKKADVIISAVGKSRVVVPENLKSGVVLIGVGTHNEDGKIRGDYRAIEIESVAKNFTTTPGGVGPVNLAYLFSNLVTAAEASV